MDKIYEQQFRKGRKEEEEEEDESNGAGSTEKKEGYACQGIPPDPPFTLRKMTGSTERTSYELSQKLDALRSLLPAEVRGWRRSGKAWSRKGARYRSDTPSGLGN